MRVSINVGGAVGGGNEDWEKTAAFVVEAERLGVDMVWSAEAWGYDAISPLAFLAGRTSRIRLGTGIIQSGTRTPALVAMTAMTMAAISGDRFVLGFGTSGPQVIEGWHGFRFRKPIQRMREIIEIVRMATSGQRVAYEGEFYRLPLPNGEGKAIRSSARPAQVPIYLATLSPKSLEMTGELADGWLGTSFMPEHAGVFTERIAAGAKKAGRSLANIDLQAGGAAAFGDLEQLIPPRKAGIAFTLGAMGSKEHNFYNQAFQRAGYQDIALEVQGLWLDGKRDEAAARVPDEMVIKTNLLGNEEEVRERVRAYRDAGITTLRVQPEGKGVEAKLETLDRVMHLVKAESAAPAAAS